MQTTALLTPSARLHTIAPMGKERLLTGAEAFKLGIEQPFELVNGQIVLIDYTGDKHGIIESELSRYLGNFTATRKQRNNCWSTAVPPTLPSSPNRKRCMVKGF